MEAYQSVFLDNHIYDHPCFSLHQSWEALADFASTLLTGLLGREIEAHIARSDYYYWAIDLTQTPLTEAETRTLADAARTSDAEMETQFEGIDFPLCELRQEFAALLLAWAMPFQVASTHADDEGVWFMSGPVEQSCVCFLVQYPETDAAADLIVAPCRPSVSIREMKTAFTEVMDARLFLPNSNRCERLDYMLKVFAEKTGAKPQVISGIVEGDLW